MKVFLNIEETKNGKYFLTIKAFDKEKVYFEDTYIIKSERLYKDIVREIKINGNAIFDLNELLVSVGLFNSNSYWSGFLYGLLMGLSCLDGE